MRWSLLVVVFSVGCCSPTSSTNIPALTERQLYIYNYTQCLGAWTGLGSIRVTFEEELGDHAAGKAVTAHRWVRYHILSVENGPDWYLAALASHEVSHLKGASEAEALVAEVEWPRVCGC